MAPGTSRQSMRKEQNGIIVYERKKARMDQVDPNIIEVQHEEAYVAKNPQGRSPSLESPILPPIIDEGGAQQEH